VDGVSDVKRVPATDLCQKASKVVTRNRRLPVLASSKLKTASLAASASLEPWASANVKATSCVGKTCHVTDLQGEIRRLVDRLSLILTYSKDRLADLIRRTFNLF
jgi:hypothetical protein